MRQFIVIFILAAACCAQSLPQEMDMFGGVMKDATGNAIAACPATHSWIDRHVTEAISTTGSPVTVHLTEGVAGVAVGNILSIEPGQVPQQVTGEVLGTGDGSRQTFTGYLAKASVLQNSLTVTAGGVTGQDQFGGIVGTGMGGTTPDNAAAPFGSLISLGTPLDTTRAWFSLYFSSPVGNSVPVTASYKWTPSEAVRITAVDAAAGTVTFTPYNTHPAGARLLQGTFRIEAIQDGAVASDVFCDPFNFPMRLAGVWNVSGDSTVSHNSEMVNTTILGPIASTGEQDVTPASMAGICAGRPGCVLDLEAGTAHESVYVMSKTGSSIRLNAKKTHPAGAALKGYNYNAVTFGECSGSTNTCQDGAGGRYGDYRVWASQTAVQLRALGINAVMPYSDARMNPWRVESGGTNPWPTPDHTHPHKMVRVAFQDTALRAQQNNQGYAVDWTRNMEFNIQPKENGYLAGVVDIYDPNFYAWAAANISDGSLTNNANGNQESMWIAAYMIDESDKIDWWANGPDFSPEAGSSDWGHPHAALVALYSNPHITGSDGAHYCSAACSGKELVFQNDQNMTKDALRKYLARKYNGSESDDSAAALNAAWSSSYSTLGSTGIEATEDLSPLPDGSTAAFTVSLANAPDPGSMWLLASDGTKLAGDFRTASTYNAGTWNNTGRFTQPTAARISASTINYTGASAGLVTVTFSVAPAASAAPLRIRYVHDGYDKGPGLLDESCQIAGHTWLPDCTVNRNTSDLTQISSSAIRDDLNGFLLEMGKHYFGSMRAVVKAQFPHTLYMTPYATGSHDAPSRKEVYQAAALYADVLGLAMNPSRNDMPRLGAPTLQLPAWDWITTYTGNLPLVHWMGRYANPDSAMHNHANNVAWQPLTQADRAAYFAGFLGGTKSARTPIGVSPHVGVARWQLLDNGSELSNWGMMSFGANLYDGSQATSGENTFTIGNFTYTAVPEAGDWGDSENPTRNAFITFTSISPGVTAAVRTKIAGAFKLTGPGRVE